MQLGAACHLDFAVNSWAWVRGGLCLGRKVGLEASVCTPPKVLSFLGLAYLAVNSTRSLQKFSMCEMAGANRDQRTMPEYIWLMARDGVIFRRSRTTHSRPTQIPRQPH